MNRILSLAFAVLLLSALTACNEPGSPVTPPAQDNTDHSAPQPAVPVFVAAVNWDGLNIFANSAKTIVDVAAHFTTDRNACGYADYAVFDTDFWNQIAVAANAAVSAPILDEKNLFCVPDILKYPMFPDGVRLKLPDGKMRQLFTPQNGQICSTIGNPDMSNALLSVVDQVIQIADKTGCPHGWGGNS